MDTAIHPGYPRVGQYQSIPSLPPSSRQRRMNHKILVLLNNFRIRLSDWSVRLEVGANIAPEIPWSEGNLQGKIVFESGQPGLSGRFTGKPAWLWKFRSGNFEHSFRDARGGRSEVNLVLNASASANGRGPWLARTRRPGRRSAGAVQRSLGRGALSDATRRLENQFLSIRCHALLAGGARNLEPSWWRDHNEFLAIFCRAW